MTADFNTLAIPVFPGINDLPTAPTATKAGNGSHLVDTVNKLIAELASQFIYNVDTWNVITVDTTLEINKKYLIFADDNSQPTILTFPLQPPTGSYITLINGRANTTCTLALDEEIYGLGVGTATLEVCGEEITLVYSASNLAWFESKQNIITVIGNLL